MARKWRSRAQATAPMTSQARRRDDIGNGHDKLDSVYNLPVTSDRTAKW